MDETERQELEDFIEDRNDPFHHERTKIMRKGRKGGFRDFPPCQPFVIQYYADKTGQK
jgi:hypothetical protein